MARSVRLCPQAPGEIDPLKNAIRGKRLGHYHASIELLHHRQKVLQAFSEVSWPIPKSMKKDRLWRRKFSKHHSLLDQVLDCLRNDRHTAIRRHHGQYGGNPFGLLHNPRRQLMPIANPGKLVPKRRGG